MKKLIALFSVPAVLACAVCTTAGAREIDYTEAVRTINNPACGYTTTCWTNCKPGATPTYNPSGNLVLFFINIGPFSSGINGEKDYPLDDAFFEAWRTTLGNCRNNGSMVALRFRYDDNGVDNPEPETFDMILRHIQQIKESHILEDYKDIIAYVESGFVGKWGEQHGGKFTTVEYKAQLLDAMLDCVPAPIPVTVRTPDTFAKWAGIDRKDLADHIPTGDECRVGLYNDGYMGSNSDLGTFADRKIETSWLSRQAVTAYYGGEFSGSIDYAKQFDTYLPENALPEMYKTHLSYINGNIFQLYKDYTFSKEYDVAGADNSAYYGSTVFQFIRDHIGYRFVLRDSQLTESVQQGGTLDMHFSVENTGFANPIPLQKAEIIIEHEGNFMRAPVSVSTNEWLSCTTADELIELTLPDSLPTGEWNAYLKITNGNNTIEQLNIRSVEFANNGIWNASLGANYMGSFTVTESGTSGTNNFFHESGTAPAENSDKMYTINNHITMDGMFTTPYEWTDNNLIEKDNDKKLYLSSDDKYMYIMADIPNNAEKPVWNLRIENAGDSYWYYRQSAGWVYYSKGNHDGISLKTDGDTAEFKIALGDFMGVNAETLLDSVRVFVQDEAHDWANVGDIKATECTVPANFPLYSAEYSVRLTEGESYTMRPEISVSDAVYQWYLDGKAIDKADTPEYTISSAGSDSVGKYSVKVTSNGVTAEIPVLTVTAVSGTLTGDINSDGTVNIADLLLLDKYILCTETLTEQEYKNADISGDKAVDSFDMVMLRKLIIK